MQFQTRTIELGQGRSLNLGFMGEGRPVVLIHGAFGDLRDWQGAPAEALAPLGQLIAIDRPGHGLSRRPRFNGSPADQAAQIFTGLEQAGVERPVLVGHSMGGMAALAMAASRPEALSGLVLVNPIAFPEIRPLEHTVLAPRAVPVVGPLLSEAGRWSADPLLLRFVQRVMFFPEPVPPDWLDRFPDRDILSPAQMVLEGEDAMAVSPLSPTAWVNLDRITAPTCIIASERDRVVDPRRHAHRLHRRIRGSRLIPIEGAGHMAHHVHADLLADAVRSLAPEEAVAA
jgi:pimeloyl-ACP methyl ester carboxylesterase